MATADANQNCVTIIRHSIPIPSTLTCLPHIHPPIIRGSLYSIHPPKPRPPSSTSPINFRIHYLFQQSFIIHPLHKTKPSQNIHIYSSCQFSPHTCSRSQKALTTSFLTVSNRDTPVILLRHFILNTFSFCLIYFHTP